MASGYMPGKVGRKYQLEHWVRSNLHSHEAKPFRFNVSGAEVTLLLPPGSEEPGGFIASTRALDYLSTAYRVDSERPQG